MLRWWFAALLLLALPAWAQEPTAARLWPSPDYTRLAIESHGTIEYRYFQLGDPDRLVIDLHDVTPNAVLDKLPAAVQADDPFVSSIRVGLNRPGVTRVVLALKAAVKPSVFNLPPNGSYGNRLVVDLYPAQGKRFSAAQILQGQDTEAASAAPQAPPAVPRQRKVVIVIDPGHGGEDPGATGPDGVHEKTVTLAIAKRIKALINKQPGMKAYLTRNGDYFIPLGERVKIARELNADVFVSIHADSAPPGVVAEGTSVYALSEKGATSVAARWLAKNENASDLMGGVNLDVKDKYLRRTLFDLSQTATINDSLKLGHDVLDAVAKMNPLHYSTVEQAAFAVLKAPDIPSILVETAYISNPVEERQLADPAYQEKLAKAIVAGLTDYVEHQPSWERTHLAEEGGTRTDFNGRGR